MEAAVRHLRDGSVPDAATCTTCCVLDSLAVIGGSMVLHHALQTFVAAMRQGRSQATCVRVVDLTGALAATCVSFASGPLDVNAHAHQQHTQQNVADVELIDLYSDPWGWCRSSAAAASSESSSSGATGPTCSAASPLMGLEALKATLLRPPTQVHAQTGVSGQSTSLQAGRSAGGPSQEGPLQAAAEARVQQDDDGNGGEEEGGGGGGRAGSTTASPQAAQEPGGRSVCVVIGCLSTLIERYGERQALALLESLQRSPRVSCLLTALHTDLHPERVAFALRRLSSCALELSPLPPLQAQLAARAVGALSGSEQQLAGRLDCRTKRRAGRVKVDSELYALCPAEPAAVAESGPGGRRGGGSEVGSVGSYRLRLFPAPPFLDLPDPKALVKMQPLANAAAAGAAGAAAASAAGAAGGAAAAESEAPTAAAVGAATGTAAAAGGGATGAAGPGQPVGLLGGVGSAQELARAVGSSMRLTLTEEERRAKAAVVLPYQHTGRARGPAADAYAAGDHAAYLPPAAGGVGPGAGGPGERALGHILYVRDSGSEADSDQELDEDLDI